jgi:hypothetical protein
MRRCEETNLKIHPMSQDQANGFGMLACKRGDYQALQVWWEIGTCHWAFILRVARSDHREISGLAQSQQPLPGSLELPGPRALGRLDICSGSRSALSRDSTAEKAEVIFTCLAVCEGIW